jgi:hypothetical protein
LQEIAEDLSDVAVVEQQPTLEGWRMTLTLAPEGTAPPKSQPAPEPAKATGGNPRMKEAPRGFFFAANHRAGARRRRLN